MADPLQTFIRERRKAADISRETLAAAAQAAAPGVEGLHRTSIERWENGVGSPSAAQMEALFRALGASDEDRLDVIRRSAATAEPTPAEAL